MPGRRQAANKACSNCVINLSPDEAKVFGEAYHALKPGAGLSVSDIVSQGTLPAEIKDNLDAWACCIGGGLERQEYLEKIKKAGFGDVQVVSSKEFYLEGEGSQPLAKLLSITVRAYK